MTPLLQMLALLAPTLGSASEFEPPSHGLRSELFGYMPRAVTSFGAEATGGWIYVLGGYNGVPHRYSREGQPGDFYRVSSVDPRNFELLPRWHRTQGTPLAVRDGIVYAVGGLHIVNAAGEPEDMRSVSDAGSFDPRTGEWTAFPAIDSGRSSHDAAFAGNTLCVVGGWQIVGSHEDARWHETMLLYDFESDSGWLEVPAPFERRALAVAGTEDRLTVIGGMQPNGKVSREVHFFEPATRAWSTGPEFPERGFGVAATAIDGTVYASASEGVLWSLRPGVDETWQRCGEMFSPRFFHELIGDSAGVTVLGGIRSMEIPGRIRVIERFDLGSSAARASTLSLPSEGLAKNRHALFLRNGEATFFGGNRTLDQHDFRPEAFAEDGRRLNLQTLRWSKTSELPVARQSQSTVLVGENVGIAAGGFGHDGEVARSFADAFAYDFEADRWTPFGSLRRPRTQFALVEHDGDLWAFGGLDYDPRRVEPFELVLEVERAPVGGGDFATTEFSLPEPRRAFGHAVLDGRLWMVGGMREDFQRVETCHAFDFESGTWSEFPAPSKPRVSPEIVASDGRLFLCGGLSDDGSGDPTPDDTVEVYDPHSESWETLPTRVPVDLVRHARFFATDHGIAFLSTHLEGERIDVGFVPIPGVDG